MKTTRKVLAIALCAILLVGASVMGTLAYLTIETGPVTNTFQVGNVKFASKALDEANVNLYGEPLKDGKVIANPKEADRVTENNYKLVPAASYTKDPTVHLDATSEDLWLFVKVTNPIADIEAAGNTTIANQMAELGWIVIDAANNIYGRENKACPATVEADREFVVFNNFTLKKDIDAKTLETYNGKQITINAYAVQAEGLDSAAAAWAATFGAAEN